jgi:hypothetical protein
MPTEYQMKHVSSKISRNDRFFSGTTSINDR